MNQNIDLTLNRDFRKERPRIRRGSALISDAKSFSLAPPDPITQSELITDFLTGSIDRIKSNQLTLEVMRSAYGIDPVCDCCGRKLLVQSNTLCNACDENMNSEMIAKRTMLLIKS